jgi:peptidyl-prolyl cis-trans isomerase C
LAIALKAFIREPLVHFLVLGAGVFGLFAFVGDRSEIEPDEIVVGAGQIERMSQAWRKTRMRPPTQPELEGLIRDYIKEEVLYREALVLGLDQDNAVIRRHLRQKMEFLSEDIAARTEPDDETLQAFLDANPDKFRTDPQITFQHIYFSWDKRGDLAAPDARQVLATLSGNETDDEVAALGDPLPLPHSVERYPVREVANLFGRDFAAQLMFVETGQWLGPVPSGFGLHLVIVDERIDAVLPQLDVVRDAVVREWREEQRQSVNEVFYETLRTRYNVVIERPEWLDMELNIEDVEQL